MDCAATALQYYVHLRLNTDPGWQGIELRLGLHESDAHTYIGLARTVIMHRI